MTPSEPAQRFALALPGVWLQANQRSFAHLGGRPAGPAARKWAKGLLKGSWNVTDEHSLRESCEWLATVGTSDVYRKGLAEHLALPAKDRYHDRHGQLFKQHAAEVGDAATLAWDHGRLINVVGWGFLAGYLTEEQAWELIMPSARLLQKHYKSWENLGDQYVLGKEFWTAADLSEDRAANEAAKRDPASPWRSIPWSTPLGAGPSAAPGSASAEEGGSSLFGMVAMAAVALTLLLVCGGVLAIVGLGGGALFMTRTTTAPSTQGGAAPVAAAASSDWDGSAPLLCEGAKKLTISGVKAKFSEGVAITTKGACQLTLVDSDIEAPIAIHSEGASKVFITNGSLTGSQHAVEAAAASQVTLTGTRVEGKLTKKGAAKITSN